MLTEESPLPCIRFDQQSCRILRCMLQAQLMHSDKKTQQDIADRQRNQSMLQMFRMDMALGSMLKQGSMYPYYKVRMMFHWNILLSGTII